MRRASSSGRTPSARIRATPSAARSAIASRDADRDGVGTTSRSAARARADASRSSRCAGTSTRVCASAASAGSTRSCSPRAVSTGSGSSAEIGLRLEPETMLPEAGQGRLALQVRAGESHLVGGGAPARRASASRPSDAAWPSSAAGASRRSRRYHDGVRLVGLIAAEDGSWVERVAGDDPDAVGARSPPTSRDAHATTDLRCRIGTLPARIACAGLAYPSGPRGRAGARDGNEDGATRDGTHRRHATRRAGRRAARARSGRPGTRPSTCR